MKIRRNTLRLRSFTPNFLGPDFSGPVNLMLPLIRSPSPSSPTSSSKPPPKSVLTHIRLTSPDFLSLLEESLNVSQVDIGYIVCIPSSALQAEHRPIFCRFGRLGICTLACHRMMLKGWRVLKSQTGSLANGRGIHSRRIPSMKQQWYIRRFGGLKDW